MRKLKPVAEQVIVITGASSGIGLATAKLAAERGAKVVLAARTRDALIQAVDEINQAAPNSASFVVADVGDYAEHERIAAHAMERHGRIDTWVNNAGVLVFGRLEELAEADMRQLFETNFWGTVHGSLVAARYLRPEGGALINIGSIESDYGVPLQGIYAASKHAVQGFTNSLRMELEEQGAPISVTLIKPASIGTPLPEHARSYEGVEPNLPRPLYAPEEVARVVLSAAEKPTPTAYVGSLGRAFSIASGVAPRTLEWISETFVVPLQQASQRPAGDDNLDRGRSEARVHGPDGGRPSLYSTAARNPVATIAVAGGLAAAGAFMLRRRGDGAETVGGMSDTQRTAGRSERVVEEVVIADDQIPVEGN